MSNDIYKFTLELVSAPASEPLVLADVKNYLKISGTDDDSLITSLIGVARMAAERFLRSSLITQSWKMVYDSWTPTCIELAMGPVQSITSVTAITRQDSSSVISSDAYYLSAGNKKLIFDANVMCHRVEVVYVAGFGDAASDVPNPIKQGMMAHIAAIYDGRAGGNVLPAQSRELFAPYRIIRL